MKYFYPFFTFFIIIFSATYSQDLLKLSTAELREIAKNSSQQDILGYIGQAKTAGYSLSEVKEIFRARGASSSELDDIEKYWNKYEDLTEDEPTNEVEQVSFESNFGVNNFEKIEEPIKLIATKEAERFGSKFFKAAKIGNETPELYLATPSNYQLGPGDQLLISLYGGSEELYETIIDPEGKIKVDQLPPIYLSGLSIETAKTVLIQNFSKIYRGLLAPNSDPSKIHFDVSLKKSRSITINIIGQVISPGTYTLSAFSSIINALYAAGGIDDIGSYRTVNLIRDQQIIEVVDLYDFLVGGKMNPILLQDQDILQIPPYESQVLLKGGFKSTGYFEIKMNETLSDILDFSGGFLSNAFKKRVFINRVLDFKRQSLTIDVEESALHLLKDGDQIEATLIEDFVENVVEIEGAVYIPGKYSLSSVSTIRELLEVAGGLNSKALGSQAILYRGSRGLERSSISINLKNKNQLNFTLNDGDRLFVPNENDFNYIGFIRVKGEVNKPGLIEYKLGMSLSDALILAGGFTPEANKSDVTVYNNFLVDGETYTQSESVTVADDLSIRNPIILSRNSTVVVRRDPNFRNVEEVYLSGLVLNEGIYALKGNNYRLYDLIQDAGGFLKDAYLNGISIRRALSNNGLSDSKILQLSLNDALDASSDRTATENDIEKQKKKIEKQIKDDSVIIGINGDRLFSPGGFNTKENILLQKGDSIFVPKLDNTITILGEIQKNSKIVFDKRLTIKKAIRFAGGFGENANRGRIYMIKKNGVIKTRRMILGLIPLDPGIEPGATIIVPEKLVQKDPGSSLTELVGISSSLATLFLLFQQLGL